MLSDNRPAPADVKPVLENPVQLRYNGASTIMVKGKQTGFLYIFSPGKEALTVDGRDAQEILSGSREFALVPG